MTDPQTTVPHDKRVDDLTLSDLIALYKLRMTEQTQTTALPRPDDWKQRNPHRTTPRCQKCDTPFLGIIPARCSLTGQDEWSCDYCGVVK